MKNKKLLVIILLSLGLCFVSGAGYGGVSKWMHESSKTSYMEGVFLGARIDYMMLNPINFLKVNFYYDLEGRLFKSMFPRLIITKGKIVITIRDNRDIFSHKSGIALLDTFKKSLEAIYSFVQVVATDMDTDVVAKLSSKEEVPLAYFYQGEYHLWDE